MCDPNGSPDIRWITASLLGPRDDKRRENMGLSIGHLLVILLIVLVLFGAGKLPQVMSDLGKGLKSFKDGMNSSDKDESDKK